MIPAKPAVSVVIPTFNRVSLLPRAIRSVVEQSFRDWELIVVDDCSTEDTESVVRSFQDPRIRYVRNARNQGLPGSRNVGLEHARAELVACLDDDDRWLPHKLERQVEVFRGSTDPRLAAVYGGVIYDHPDGREVYYPPRRRGDLRRALLCERYVVVGGFSCLLFRRDAALAVGGFDARLKMREDYELQLRMSQAGFTFDYVDEPLLHYRADGGDSLSRKSRRRAWGVLQVFRKHRADFVGTPGALHFEDLLLASRYLVKAGHPKLAWRVYLSAVRLGGAPPWGWQVVRGMAVTPAKIALSRISRRR